MLIGVSRAYKESSNCRMEAQYGMQKKRDKIPLMLQDGYEADGWLGLMLGTSLWYALFGATLETASSEALCLLLVIDVCSDRLLVVYRRVLSRGAWTILFGSSGHAAAPVL